MCFRAQAGGKRAPPARHFRCGEPGPPDVAFSRSPSVPLSEVALPMIERFAGRYALLRTLGEGGMGQVHLARDLSTGAECAIKRIRTRGDLDLHENLRREFEALIQIRDPAVVGVHHYGVTAEGEPYLVMEYVPGLPAHETTASGDWRTACFVAAEVAGGLEALHRAGVTHGDLKPANVLVIGSP